MDNFQPYAQDLKAKAQKKFHYLKISGTDVTVRICCIDGFSLYLGAESVGCQRLGGVAV